jgi:hypothetical protein
MTLSIEIQHNSIECHFAECRDYLNVMLSVIILNVIVLSVIRLKVVMLSVVAPHCFISCGTIYLQKKTHNFLANF